MIKKNFLKYLDFIKFLWINFIIVVSIILFASKFLVVSEHYLNNYSFLIIKNSIWLLWFINTFFIKFLTDIQIIIINILLLLLIYYLAYKYNKKNIWFIISILFIIISLFIWYFFQIISMQ